MPARSAKQPLPYNPSVLRWARVWRHRTYEDAAKRVGTSADNIRAWEMGDGVPTVRQARQLADFYDRSFLEFFLDAPPPIDETAAVPDFRVHKDAPDPKGDREVKAIQDWAEEQRLNAIDLFSMMGETPPSVPARLAATIADNPETLATYAREDVGFSIERQLSLTSSERAELPKIIRKCLENSGVLVLKDSALAKYDVRGLCIYEPVLPVMVFGAEAPAAQAFTMAHELGHIVLQQSAVSGAPADKKDETAEEQIERWCDKFAGAFLIPADAMAVYWAKPNRPVAVVGDEMLGNIASAFKVSRHAMLIRLVHLGYVEPDYYWDVKRPQFLQEERDFKAGGRSKYYGSRYRNSHGDLYTALVLEAWAAGVITNHNAAEFMGIKNLRHLDDIRNEFRS